MPRQQPVSPRLQSLLDAWESLDAERILDHYAPDADLRHAGVTVEGREAIRGVVAEVVGALRELEVEPSQVLEREDSAAALLRVQGRFARDLAAEGFAALPVADQSFDVEFGAFLTFDADGRIRHERQLYDSLALAAALGVPLEQARGLVERAAPPA